MASTAAAAAAVAQAIKASGAIVQLEAPEFERIVRKAGDPIVVHSLSGVFSKRHQYLTSYKGLIFYTKTPDELYFAATVEILESKHIWIPG